SRASRTGTDRRRARIPPRRNSDPKTLRFRNIPLSTRDGELLPFAAGRACFGMADEDGRGFDPGWAVEGDADDASGAPRARWRAGRASQPHHHGEQWRRGAHAVAREGAAPVRVRLITEGNYPTVVGGVT